MRDFDFEVNQFFGDRFLATDTKSRFDVMIDHYAKKFEISSDEVQKAYEFTFQQHQTGQIQSFAGYLASVCKSKSHKEYTPEQEKSYIKRNISQRSDKVLEDYIARYDRGERRVYAPHMGITRKELNDMAYEAAKQELGKRHQNSMENREKTSGLGKNHMPSSM